MREHLAASGKGAGRAASYLRGRRGLHDHLQVVALTNFKGGSPDAWARAKAATGSEQAAAVVAAMLERHDRIRSSGGCLKKLTAQAEEGSPG